MEELKNEILLQSKRGTAYPIFIVVDDEKVYGVESGWSEGSERTDAEDLEDVGTCDNCLKTYKEIGELPDSCDDCAPDAFVNYRIEKDVPNLRAGFFFTAKACNDHIEANRHHYGFTARSYAISASRNEELMSVMNYIVGEENINKLR